MAQRPLRLCHKCGGIHREQRCPKCTKSERKVYEARPDRQADKRFYGQARWQRFRAAILGERPLCERCLEKGGRVNGSEHVHHIKARKDAPHLAFEPTNVMALCLPCHSSIEATIRWHFGA